MTTNNLHCQHDRATQTTFVEVGDHVIVASDDNIGALITDPNLTEALIEQQRRRDALVNADQAA